MIGKMPPLSASLRSFMALLDKNSCQEPKPLAFWKYIAAVIGWTIGYAAGVDAAFDSEVEACLISALD